MAGFNPVQFNPIPPQFRLTDSDTQASAPSVAVADDDSGEDNGFYTDPSKRKKSVPTDVGTTQVSFLFSYDQFDSRIFSDTIGLRLSSSFKTSPGSIASIGVYGHGWLSAQGHYSSDDPSTSGYGDPFPAGLSGGVDLRFGNCIKETKVCPSAGFNVGLDPFRVISGLVIFAWDSWEVGADLGLQLGPIELRGGFYPNGRTVLANVRVGNGHGAEWLSWPDNTDVTPKNPTLSALNPGLRIGGNFPVK